MVTEETAQWYAILPALPLSSPLLTALIPTPPVLVAACCEPAAVKLDTLMLIKLFHHQLSAQIVGWGKGTKGRRDLAAE
jgi:hypothetical protein